MNDFEDLHKKMSALSLHDLLLLCAQAINMGFPESKIDMMLRYVEIAISKRKMFKPIEGGER